MDPPISIFLFLLLAPLTSQWVHGQDNSDPFTDKKAKEEPFDAFAEAGKQMKESAKRARPRITLLTEFIQLSQRDWSELSKNEDDSDLRREVGKKLKSGHAALLDMNLVSTVSGFDFVTDSFEFHIYPSLFNPPEVDEKNGRIVPVSYAASECSRSGFTTHGNAVLAKDCSSVVLNIVPEYVGMSGTSKAGTGNGGVSIPKFTEHRIYSNLAVAPGEFALAGVFQAHQPDHPDRSAEVVLVFFRPTVEITDPDPVAAE